MGRRIPKAKIVAHINFPCSLIKNQYLEESVSIIVAAIILGIRVFARLMQAVVNPSNATIEKNPIKERTFLVLKATSAKSSYVFLPVLSAQWTFENSQSFNVETYQQRRSIGICKSSSHNQKCTEPNPSQTKDVWHSNCSSTHSSSNQIPCRSRYTSGFEQRLFIILH